MIVTNAGGPAVLATDMLITGGGQLAQLAPDLLKALNGFLPPAWSHNNPIDVPEIIKDRALGLPPLNATLARRILERTQIYHALKRSAGTQAGRSGGAEQLLVRSVNW